MTSVTQTSKTKTSAGTVVISKTQSWSYKFFAQSKMVQPRQVLNLKMKDAFKHSGLLMKSRRCLKSIVLLMEHSWTRQVHKIACLETWLTCLKSSKLGSKWSFIASPTPKQPMRKRTRTLESSPVWIVAKLMERQSQDLPSCSRRKRRKSFWTVRYHSQHKSLEVVNKEGLTRKLHCVWKA